MPIVVKAVPKAEFEQWLAAEKAKHAPAPAAAPADAAPAPADATATPAPTAQATAGRRARGRLIDRPASSDTPDDAFKRQASEVGSTCPRIRSRRSCPRRPCHDDHGHKLSFVERWFFSTNHKDIGTLYLIFSFIMFIIGAAMSVVIRAELAEPGLQFVKPEFFNQMTTMHALVMIFGGDHAGLRRPGQLDGAAADRRAGHGAAAHEQLVVLDPAVRLHPAAVDAVPARAARRPAAGRMYPPLMLQGGANVAFTIFAIHMMGISSIMGAINIIATILNMRAPGMDLLKMPMFAWTWLITAFLLIAVMPVLAGAVTMLLTDKFFGTSFFNAAGGGDPVMFQHIFWFFGHPEVYIMILPAFGIAQRDHPDLLAQAAVRLPGDGVRDRVDRVPVSFIVWAHHMFTVGMPLGGEIYFMYATMLIAVPTGVKVFNWVSTMWRGSLTFETPMLWAIAFVILFTIGGFSGPDAGDRAGRLPVPRHLLRGRALPLRAGDRRAVRASSPRVYYWWPKWTGRMYSETWGKFHFWWTMVFVNLLFFPQHFLGLAGMPRRIPDYNVVFADWNLVSSIGAFGMFVTPFLMFGILFWSLKRGAEGRGARLGRRARPGVDGAVAGAAPHLHHAAGDP